MFSPCPSRQSISWNWSYARSARWRAVRFPSVLGHCGAVLGTQFPLDASSITPTARPREGLGRRLKAGNRAMQNTYPPRCARKPAEIRHFGLGQISYAVTTRLLHRWADGCRSVLDASPSRQPLTIHCVEREDISPAIGRLILSPGLTAMQLLWGASWT